MYLLVVRFVVILVSCLVRCFASCTRELLVTGFEVGCFVWGFVLCVFVCVCFVCIVYVMLCVGHVDVCYVRGFLERV